MSASSAPKSRISGVFLCEEKVWGMPVNRSSKPPGSWHHVAVTPEPSLIFRPSPLLTTYQVIAEKLNGGAPTADVVKSELDKLREEFEAKLKARDDEAQKASYERRDAARANGWARRKRNGWVPPAQPVEAGGMSPEMAEDEWPTFHSDGW